MLKDEKVFLNELVEDELLLALPDFPRHKNQCLKVLAMGVNYNDEQADTSNPFSVLAEFKNTGD
jgi:uncharacterized protein